MLTEGIIYLTNKKETRLCVQYMFTIPALGQGRASECEASLGSTARPDSETKQSTKQTKYQRQ